MSLAGDLLRAILATILCVVFCQTGLATETRESTQPYAGYIDPAPRGKHYRLYVLGDSFAANVADGLIWALRDVRDVHVVKRTRAATGLVRDDVLDWTRSVADLVKDEPVDIAVIALGGNDRQDIRVRGKRYRRFTAPWRAEYRRRVANFMRTLRTRVAVYWIGLPSVRSRQMSTDYERLNRVYRDLARAHGIRFLDISDRLRGTSNGYTAYGRGINGATVRLRDGDGIHFTLAGSRVLGRLIAEDIRLDLRAARSASHDGN